MSSLSLLPIPHRTYWHTVSASYNDPRHSQFGSLRVLNEDRVDAHTGFGTHGHREFEIFSYVVSGELQQSVLSAAHIIYSDVDIIL